eukprot:TRINITY_DN48250_c0_g1_i1.p2 TRINITY_DN48250_c0_g1~~TRINITY_DN48250_c0_g1_i1.p2  ORF type:complete len:102 (-),score=20.63 TRINITY_DN48250_c0_g1_i1:10-288(-)
MDNLVDRISKAYEADQARASEPLRIGSLPLSYEALTNEWLSDALCRGIAGGQVVSYSLGPVDTGSSNRRRIRKIGRAVQQECRDRSRMPSSA